MIIYKDFKVKKWDPKILLHSGRNFLATIGVGATQLTLGDVAFSNIKTVKKTIGYPGSVVLGLADFQWTGDANTTAQNKDLGSIIPALARILDVKIITEATHTGGVSLAITAGNVSAGSQFVATGANYTKDAVRAIAHGDGLGVAPVIAASKVWIGGTPGANWSLMTAGILAVYVTYIEI
jgi:hypothetical protein